MFKRKIRGVNALVVSVSGRHVALGFALLAVACGGLLGAATARAEQAAYASTNTDASRRLSSESLAVMMGAEDEFNDAVRMAAYRKGLELAKQAVAADDLNADAHFAVFANNGRIMLLEGISPNPFSLLEVNRELDRALALNPDHADALASKGGLYRQLPRILGGSIDKAQECLNRAIALDPDAVGARMELAQAYRDLGQPERGLPLLEKAVRSAEKKGFRRKLAEARSLLEEFKTANR